MLQELPPCFIRGRANICPSKALIHAKSYSGNCGKGFGYRLGDIFIEILVMDILSGWKFVPHTEGLKFLLFH